MLPGLSLGAILLFLPGCTGLFGDDGGGGEPTRPLTPCERSLNGYHLAVAPVRVVPHRRTYRVGDTVRFRFFEPTRLRDTAVRETYDLRAFPFRPVFLPVRFPPGAPASAAEFPVGRGEVHVDAAYRPEVVSDGRGVAARMWARVERDSFFAEAALALTAPGEYVTVWYDVWTVTSSDGDGRAYAEPVEFAGKCSAGFQISNYVRGDDHLDAFVPALQRFDTLRLGKWSRADVLDRGPFGGGSAYFEDRGGFAFEVVE